MQLAGGIPSEVRLGNVVISTPVGTFPGVVQWDMGRANQDGFERSGALNNPPLSLMGAISKLETAHELVGTRVPEFLEEMPQKWPRLTEKYLRSQSLEDLLFRADYDHVSGGVEEDYEGEQDQASCHFCDKTNTVKRKPRDIRVHYGLIASGNQVIKNAGVRARLNKDLGGNVLCVEMEAAGRMDDFPCVVIRGICDYADSHKSMGWQEHAAALAAAVAKELLSIITPEDVDVEPRARDKLQRVNFTHPIRNFSNVIVGIVKQVKQNLKIIHRKVDDGFRKADDNFRISSRV